MEKWIIYVIISMLSAGLTLVIAKFGMKDLSSGQKTYSFLLFQLLPLLSNEYFITVQ